MKQIQKHILRLGVLLMLLLPGFSMNAADTNYTLGGGSGQLDIRMQSGGLFNVYRNGQRQLFTTAGSPLFTIKIGSTNYRSLGLTSEDVESSNSGSLQTRTKKYSGTHSGRAFSVTATFIYDTSNPDYFVIETDLDLENITSGTASFAFGFDSYVNACDGGAAIIIPDLGYNGVAGTGPGNSNDRNLTQAQVRNLRLVGTQNNYGAGSLIGFVPMGRSFDRAWSADYTSSYSHIVINSTTNTFRFGSYNVPCIGTGTWDAGIGVVYDNIATGTTTSLRQMLTFSEELNGELDYTWGGQKDRTAAIGDNVSLNLTYKSYSSNALSGVGFRVNYPGLANVASGYSLSGFTGGSVTRATNGTHYRIQNANISALGTANITLPLHVEQCGQYVINAGSIANTAKTLPMGTPATLTVTAPVTLTGSATTVAPGSSVTYTVKFPDGITPATNTVIRIDYSGSTGQFSSRPATVTIPAGQNSATFTVTSSSSASIDRKSVV